MTLTKKLEPDASIYTLVLILLLAVDSVIVRPVAIYMQRILADEYPPSPPKRAIADKSSHIVQRLCRFLFFVEGVLQGVIGGTYFMFPELFFYLYGYPTTDSDAVTLWCLSQFGVLLMAFGLYQMSCEMDQSKGMMAWWLVLNSLWLYVFWEGTGSRLGKWNPFALAGATHWCHAAFHLVTSLALVRWICLISFLFSGRDTMPTVARTPTDGRKMKKSD